jgi:probable LLM family oxidoreductase
MELGLYTFVEATRDPDTGRIPSPAARVRDLMEEIELADQVGLDVVGIGEHHRADYVASSPATLLAAAAVRTSRLRLTSAVTVLSSDDPVRVFQQFATVDLLSNGRAEIMAGRGSFIESFPLFGHDLDDYDALFAEKLALLLQLRDGERVTWRGQHRAALADQPVYPRPVQQPLPVWIAVGGTPQSVVRAGRLGLPMAVANIGGTWRPFAQFFDLYREAATRAGHDASALPVSLNAHGFIADSRAAAERLAIPRLHEVMSRIGRERGWAPPTRARFEGEMRPEGALFIGEPEAIAEKILAQHAVFRHDRFLLQLSVGTMPHAAMLRAIELFGTKVAPIVRRELAPVSAAVAG